MTAAAFSLSDAFDMYDMSDLSLSHISEFRDLPFPDKRAEAKRYARSSHL